MRPIENQLEHWLQFVTHVAQAAGHEIMKIYDSPFEVQRKLDKSPLTAADIAAHELIVRELGRLEPRLPVLSEESPAIEFSERRQWPRYWLIDPLDGTREFVKRNGEFTVNIALIDGHEPVLGVVYAPVLEVLYYASRGTGAYKRERQNETNKIHTRKAPTDTITVAGSRSHSDRRMEEYLTRLGAHEIIGMGSSIKACLVAEGKVDLYPRFGPTSEWDTAAAQCIVEEAGGAITTTNMQPLRYNTQSSLINPSFFVFGDSSRNWAQYL
ncbi:MAG TPA: 3'(2'),5'-bisphosphate nucleotidase CysQ [Gammaproteobacteria bacterium]